MGFLIFLGIGAGVVLAFLILIFVVGCVEKQTVRMFESQQLQDLPPYMAAVVQQAMSFGLVFRDSGIHTKFREKILGVLMMTTDGSILAIIGQGKVLGMKTKKTILLSRFADGRILLTLDESGMAELDPLTTRRHLMNADFAELFPEHVDGVNRLGAMPLPFRLDAMWKDVDAVYQLRSDRIVQSGLARYTDASHQFFRYTIWGSFRTSVLHALTQIFNPANHARHRNPRPGDV